MKNKSFIYLLAYVILVVFIAEMIGFQSISILGFKFNFLPLVFALLITMFLAIKPLRKGILKKVYADENVDFSSKYI